MALTLFLGWLIFGGAYIRREVCASEQGGLYLRGAYIRDFTYFSIGFMTKRKMYVFIILIQIFFCHIMFHIPQDFFLRYLPIRWLIHGQNCFYEFQEDICIYIPLYSDHKLHYEFCLSQSLVVMYELRYRIHRRQTHFVFSKPRNRSCR